MKTCERCGAAPALRRTPDGEWTRALLDYCADCSRDLCPECMAQGCCGKVPAASGTEADFGEDEE